MLGGKVKSYTKHLLSCSSIEEENFRLYQCIAKKLNQPDLRSLVMSIGYDSFKHSKLILEMLKTVDKPEINPRDFSKQISELWKYLAEFSKHINECELVTTEDVVETFKFLVDLEDCFAEVYRKVLESDILQVLAEELSKLTPVTAKSLRRVFETIVSEKERHRELLIDENYYFASKKRLGVNNTPSVRYRNPDGWIMSNA